MYRIRQFLQALTAQVQPEERALVEKILTPSQSALFYSMPLHDRRHALDVLYTLRRQGYQALPLLRAALLHDVGKAGHLHLWHRVAVVLLERFAPRMLQWLADDRPGSWGYPFFIHLNHPRLGAQQAEKVGCDKLTVELIRRHHEPVSAVGDSGRDRLLAALQAADGQV